MKPTFKSILLMALMLLSAGLAIYIRPTLRIADQKAPVNLEKIIPESFGDWREVKQSTQQIVNPQEQQMLNGIYSQTLSRTYINAAGFRVMLSIAYGGDQSRDLQIHRPEVCYSSQGFQILNTKKTLVNVGNDSIPAMHLAARQGRRSEPITYWVRIGEKIVRGNLEQGIARFGYGLSGYVPDGILFRVSSLSDEMDNAYQLQKRFIVDLLVAVDPTTRRFLVGAVSTLDGVTKP
jgi:EpsI family protein